MFELVHKIDISKEKPKTTSAFHFILMTMLLRYASLSGGQLPNSSCGGSLQGTTHPNHFRVLERSLGQSCFECFACRRSIPTIPDLDPRLLTWTGTLDLLVIFSILPKSKDAFK